ncbi:AAA family ATPase [Chachezhania sediminis]|uniref:AAA family ATPase n=1 Tax=Chachezhania sediminis TaxID=2599291 RepID=UPI00131D10BB|nr:AAA family ATPase [Chachezhania sediminis]
MTETSPQLPLPRNNGAKRPLWWAFAQDCLARLHASETDIVDLERRATAGDTAAVDTLMEYEGGDRPKPPSRRAASGMQSAAVAVGRVSSAPHLPPEEWDAIAADGGDPFATAKDGRTRPATPLPLSDVILLARLAATFRTVDRWEASLQPGALTVVIGLEPTLSLGKLLTAAMLPEGWSNQSRAPRSAPHPVLQLPDRPVLEKELERLLHHPAPILLPVARQEHLPALVGSGETGARVLVLEKVNADILLFALSVSHSATGRIDEESVRSTLPDDESLASLEAGHLAMACRAPTAREVAERISLMTRTAPVGEVARQGPGPVIIDGTMPAHQTARNIVEDLAAWQAGDLDWSEMSRSLLIHGAPGTGKTYLARQIAEAAGVGLVEGSFADWQAAGHLGHMLAAMAKCFDEAAVKAPCVLFVDEIDAAGSRFDGDQNGMNYRVQVVNGFLQQIDRLTRTQGVILIGACNQISRLDPAITRPGRFDQIERMPLPSLSDIRRILGKVLTSTLPESEIYTFARAAVGKTPADLDAAVRAARADARRRRAPMSPGLLRKHLGIDQPNPELLRRIAVHEAGHAIAAELLAPGSVVKLSLSDRGGLTERHSKLSQLTTEEIEVELLILMSGRASERLVLASISGGAGGDADSDIALATSLVLQMDREFGLGLNGDGWLGPADMHRLTGDEKQRVRAKLGEAMTRAENLLEPHLEQLGKVATMLINVRELQGHELMASIHRL